MFPPLPFSDVLLERWGFILFLKRRHAGQLLERDNRENWGAAERESRCPNGGFSKRGEEDQLTAAEVCGFVQLM